MNSKEINDAIKHYIKGGGAFSFGKMGSVEAQVVWRYLQTGKADIYNSQLHINAGVCTPSVDSYERWVHQYISSVMSLDYILQWCPNKEDENILLHGRYTGKVFHSFEGLEPFVFGEDGWHYSLEGKTVLVVSPFSDTINQQVEKFDKIWPGAKIGNVITITSQYPDALTGKPPLDWGIKAVELISAISSMEFDFATVGCGGLSLLMCHYIKSMGKPCVHLGGGNQLLFGIRGKRWDEGFKHHKWYGTEHWTRPLPHEVPTGKNMVEGGCYW